MSHDDEQGSATTRYLNRREVIRLFGGTVAAALVSRGHAQAAGRSAASTATAGAGSSVEPFRVVALGDSVMWGQGLTREQSFARLVNRQLAQELKRPFRAEISYARSGAVIEDGDTELGRIGEREAFVDTYPPLFFRQSDRRAFVTGEIGNGTPALKLYRDLPAAYPTVRQQILMVSDDEGRATDLLLINGGVNDVGADAILDPINGLSYQELDTAIRDLLGKRTRTMLTAARLKFPNAIIIVPGYFPVLSEYSSIGHLKDFLVHLKEHFEGVRPWKITLNRKLGSRYLGYPWPLQNPGPPAIRMVERARWAYPRGLFHQRKAVAEAVADPEVRGPGIFFAHSRFSALQAAAMKEENTSLVFHEYDPTIDPGRRERIENCPREPLLNTIKRLARLMMFSAATYENAEAAHWRGAVALGRELRPQLAGNSIDFGPSSLIESLRVFLEEWDKHRLTRRERFELLRKRVLQGLEDEWLRIERARIASVLHPNVAGAKRYAAMIVDTYQGKNQRKLRESLALLEPDYVLRIRNDVLRRYGLDPAWPDEVVEQYLGVDSLAMHIESVDYNGPWQLAVPGTAALVSWRVGRHFAELPLWDARELASEVANPANSQSAVRFPRSRSTAASWFFTLDPNRRLDLWDLRGLRLVYHASAKRQGFGGTWRPGVVRLHVNGREVMTHTIDKSLSSGKFLTLPYPKPA